MVSAIYNPTVGTVTAVAGGPTRRRPKRGPHTEILIPPYVINQTLIQGWHIVTTRTHSICPSGTPHFWHFVAISTGHGWRVERRASRCGWRRLHRYAIGSPSPLLPSSWVGTVSSPRAARRLVVHHRRVTPAPLFSWISTRRVACTLARSFAALGRSFLDMEQLCRFWIRA